MLIHISIIIIVIQVISILFTGYFGIYNAILIISQFPIQSIISLIIFFSILMYFLFSRKHEKIYDANLLWVSTSLLLIYVISFIFRLILQKFGVSQDYTINLEFVSPSGFFIQTILNFAISFCYLFLHYFFFEKVSFFNYSTLLISILLNISFPTITCIQLLYLEIIGSKI